MQTASRSPDLAAMQLLSFVYGFNANQSFKVTRSDAREEIIDTGQGYLRGDVVVILSESAIVGEVKVVVVVVVVEGVVDEENEAVVVAVVVVVCRCSGVVL